MIQQFIIPALVSLVTSSALVAAFYYREYLALKKKVETLSPSDAGTLDETVMEMARKLAENSRQLETYKLRVDELERRKGSSYETAAAAAAAPAPASSASSMTNRRSQVMRLHRSGESIASIASALGVSQGEVKLMVKVQELLGENGNVDRSSDFL